MPFSTSCLLLAIASTVTAQYTNQSALFSLVLTSCNLTINASILAPCHEGAAIEGLCVGTAPAVNISTAYFQFNTTGDDTDIEPALSLGVTGLLTYELRGSNFNLSSPMSLSINPTSNVAIPIFTPGDEVTYVAFDADEKLNIQGSLDDTVYPQKYSQTAYYRWYSCITDYGYTYQTLAWVIGPGAPENPTCVEVDVVRVFA